jgi:glyoxylate reductase
MLGHRINGKRLGIIGMGQIGQAIARRARGFGMSVHYHNRNAVHPAIEAELEATYWDDLDEMLRRMDIVSVNCPFTDATKGLVSAERLALMPEHAYLVNTARGEIVDEIALAQALEAGAIAGAGLDVYADEPSIPESLRALNNVVMLPHIGSATIEGRHAMGDKVIINIQTFLDGHTPPDRVLAAML